MSDAIKLFGTDGCEDTRHTRHHLDELAVGYDYVNIDEDEIARDWVVQQNGGEQKTPTLMVKGLTLSIPSDRDLDQALRQSGLIDAPPAA
jgi:glutaredoxin